MIEAALAALVLVSAGDAHALGKLLPGDREALLGGWGNVCAAELVAGGVVIAAVRERNAMVLRDARGKIEVALLSPAYRDKTASYTLAGNYENSSALDIKGSLQIDARSAHKAAEGTEYAAKLAVSTPAGTTEVPVRVIDHCGRNSRLVHGPRGAEFLNRLLTR
jgi:hypothetical protein